MNTYYVPGCVLGTGNTAMNKRIKHPAFVEPTFGWGGQMMGEKGKYILCQMVERTMKKNTAGEEGSRALQRRRVQFYTGRSGVPP